MSLLETFSKKFGFTTEEDDENGMEPDDRETEEEDVDEEEDEEPRRGVSSSPAPQTHDHIPSTSLDVKGRLEQLKDLKEAGLLSQEEYDKKRQEILKGL